MGTEQIQAARLVSALTLIDVPVVVTPVAPTSGRPQAVQVAAPRWREDIALAAAQDIEQRLAPTSPALPRVQCTVICPAGGCSFGVQMDRQCSYFNLGRGPLSDSLKMRTWSYTDLDLFGDGEFSSSGDLCLAIEPLTTRRIHSEITAA